MSEFSAYQRTRFCGEYGAAETRRDDPTNLPVQANVFRVAGQNSCLPVEALAPLLLTLAAIARAGSIRSLVRPPELDHKVHTGLVELLWWDLCIPS